MPSKPRGPGQTQVSLSLPRHLLEQIDHECQRRDLTRSQLLRMAVREQLAPYTTKREKPESKK